MIDQQNLISIFTPTYNRAYIIGKLYNSLCNQTYRNFEWVVVDDGSTDDTEELINSFITENRINIIFYKQKNQGKHIAINKGIELANGELFFIVDSDDYLTKDAFATIADNLTELEQLDVCGLVFNRVTPSLNTIGKQATFEKIKCSLYDLKFKYKLNSDKAEIFKTEIIRKFPFPYFESEKFSPEALVMYRMSGEYQIVYVNKGIYVCEYQPGGLTANITKIRMNSPKGTTLYYYEQFLRSHTVLLKMKSAINFYRFQANNMKIEDKISFPYLLLNPLGKLMYLMDKKKINI